MGVIKDDNFTASITWCWTLLIHVTAERLRVVM